VPVISRIGARADAPATVLGSEEAY
jgi:hypothetical protein